MSSIIEVAEEHGEFEMLDDGFVYYWPCPNNCGALTANNLRVIADELDRRNRQWEDQIENDMGKR